MNDAHPNCHSRHPILRELLLLLAGVLLALAATSQASALVVRIGVAGAGAGQPPTFPGTLGIVRNQQLLEKALAPRGIQVRWYFFKGAGPAVNEALANGQLDLAYQGDLASIIGYANGIDTKIIALVDKQTPILLAVPSDSPIHSVKDLKGKNVGIFFGTIFHLTANLILQHEGLSQHDINAINMDPMAATAALMSHSIDATFSSVNLFHLRDQGAIRFIQQPFMNNPRYTNQGALLATPDFIKKHADVVQTVIDRLVKVDQWASAKANREAVFRQYTKAGIPLQTFREQYQHKPIAADISPVIDDYAIARYQLGANEAERLLLIRHPISTTGWFDSRFVNHALAKLHAQSLWSTFNADGTLIKKGSADGDYWQALEKVQ